MCWDHYPGLEEWPLGGAAAIWFKKSFSWPFGLFFALLDHDGHSGYGERFQHIAPDMIKLDRTLIHAGPPFRSRQACLWPQNDHSWHF